jgi:hypothetical protein
MTQPRLLSYVALIAGTALLLGGCPVTKYSGDGALIDNGSGAATDRYVLDLGPIDLTQRARKTFRLVGLPQSNFVVGIQIKAAADPALISGRLLNPTISLSLSDSSGTVLFSKRSSLDGWTWSVPASAGTAFVYGREDPSTYFDAAAGAEYTLILDVVEPDQSGSKYVAVLTAKAGGWK